MNRRLDELQSRSECLGEDKNLLPPPGIEKMSQNANVYKREQQTKNYTQEES
jgi:hypothetical protein